jgi:hypothetical protein
MNPILKQLLCLGVPKLIGWISDAVEKRRRRKAQEKLEREMHDQAIDYYDQVNRERQEMTVTEGERKFFGGGGV